MTDILYDTDLAWIKDDRNWIPLYEAAKLEGMTISEYHTFLDQLFAGKDAEYIVAVLRSSVDQQLEVHTDILTRLAYGKLQIIRKKQQEVSVKLRNTLQSLGFRLYGLPRPQDFDVSELLRNKN